MNILEISSSDSPAVLLEEKDKVLQEVKFGFVRRLVGGAVQEIFSIT